MGAQDSLDLANEFVATTGAETPLMIWDTGFDTWSYYGVTGQPTVVLTDAAGNPIQGWRGIFDADAVLDAAAAA